MSNIRDFNFQQQLVMSQGIAKNTSIREILLSQIPGALAAFPSHEINDRTGTDWWVEHSRGTHLSVDTKTRKDDFGKDDLALETFSVKERGIVGWTRDDRKRCDYILFFWESSLRWCLVPFLPMQKVFCQHWEHWRREFKWAEQTTSKRYTSECIFVPRRVLWAEIYKTSAGVLIPQNMGEEA